jgi:predicted  nucleic acid-binding Zn-ribbon protein
VLKNCVKVGAGVYKFVYGAASAQRTVLRSATDLMLDAMREYDEQARDSDQPLAHTEPANETVASDEVLATNERAERSTANEEVP